MLARLARPLASLSLSLSAISIGGCYGHWPTPDAGAEAVGPDDGKEDQPGVADDDGVLRVVGPPLDLLEPPGDPGHVAYTLEERFYRIRAAAGATPEDVSGALDRFSPGLDITINLSPDGEWMLLDTGRFGCEGWPCLALVRVDLSEMGRLEVGGEIVHTSGRHPAVASGGDLVIYPTDQGTHLMDLFAIRRTPTGWTTPINLTVDSPYDYQHDPAISDDGTRVVFDCGVEPYGVRANAICEVHTDGTGFRVLLDPTAGGTATNALHQPDYAPDGGVYFEADWGGERVWHLPAGATAPTMATPQGKSDDNSPCVLPDGSIVSLWMNRPGGVGYHELKWMEADATNEFMLVIDVDVSDIGMGCGR